VEQMKKTGGPACCKGSRAARRRLQQVRLLFRGGDLTTDSSGLGVGVPSSGCSGFAVARHGTPSSGGLACKADSGSAAPGWASWRLRPPVRLLHSSHLPLLLWIATQQEG
jgi:hypothetical protein